MRYWTQDLFLRINVDVIPASSTYAFVTESGDKGHTRIRNDARRSRLRQDCVKSNIVLVLLHKEKSLTKTMYTLLVKPSCEKQGQTCSIYRIRVMTAINGIATILP